MLDMFLESSPDLTGSSAAQQESSHPVTAALPLPAILPLTKTP